METVILIHSLLRWVLLFLIVFSIVNSFLGKQQSKAFTSQDGSLNLMLMIVTDTQLVLGLLLYFMGEWGYKSFRNFPMKDVMGNSYTRFFAVEHLIGMLLAIVLIHIGRAKMKKKASDREKHQTVFVYNLIALIIILATIPWPFRALFENRGWI